MYYIFFDKVFQYFDRAFGLYKLTTVQYLVVTFSLIFLLAILLLRKKPKEKTGRERGMVAALAYLSAALLTAGLVTSVKAYHYTSLTVLALILALTTFLLAAHSEERTGRGLLVALLVLMVVYSGSRPLVNGIEEQETTSDTINIYLNGFFRWSIHGSHYDLMPVDPVIKVALLQVAGINNVFDPATASAIYIAHGLAYVLLLYSLLRTHYSNALPMVGLSLILYPYSAMVGLSVPPAPLSQLIGAIALMYILKIVLTARYTLSDFIIISMTMTYSILAHPSALGLLLLLILLSLVNRKAVPIIAIVGVIIYFFKVFYTYFAQGFISYIDLILSYIMSAFKREEVTTFTTRNVAFSGLPRPCITGFAIFPAIFAAYFMLTAMDIVRRRKMAIIDAAFLATAFLYGAFFIASYLTGVGGVSQSRTLFNGVQTYAEVMLITHAIVTKRYNTKNLALLLFLSSLFTLATPNAMPLNYTIPMAKLATETDHIVAYTFFHLLSKQTFLAMYNNPDYGRIVADQTDPSFYYGLGSTQPVVYFYIAPGIVDAKSYWDPRIMAIFRSPNNVSSYIENNVFSAWVYVFKLYTRA